MKNNIKPDQQFKEDKEGKMSTRISQRMVDNVKVVRSQGRESKPRRRAPLKRPRVKLFCRLCGALVDPDKMGRCPVHGKKLPYI